MPLNSSFCFSSFAIINLVINAAAASYFRVESKLSSYLFSSCGIILFCLLLIGILCKGKPDCLLHEVCSAPCLGKTQTILPRLLSFFLNPMVSKMKNSLHCRLINNCLGCFNLATIFSAGQNIISPNIP